MAETIQLYTETTHMITTNGKVDFTCTLRISLHSGSRDIVMEFREFDTEKRKTLTLKKELVDGHVYDSSAKCIRYIIKRFDEYVTDGGLPAIYSIDKLPY